jgi:endonuclease/exonuclease/phosphatase family metal-dependent hydrolase
VKYFNFIVAIVLTLLYSIGKIPPSEDYNLWIGTFIIPFALGLNIIFLLIALLLRKKSSLYYLVTLVIGSNYLFGTIGLKSIFKRDGLSEQSFRVLSFNSHSLGGRFLTPRSFNEMTKATADHKAWILEQDADIQCYQEFINYNGHKEHDVVRKMNEKGYHGYFSFDSTQHNVNSVSVGTLILSKYPIIKTGDIMVSTNGFNRITFADVNINGDTLRIINVHLESMGLKQFDPIHTSGFQSRKENAKIILARLKEGVFERSRQIKILRDFIEASSYPVICVGDFNDMPYSYSYQFMRRKLKNAFEERGTGFGFTYNGNTLRALRIDNQFYTTGVTAVNFETLHDVKHSDHFPIIGQYQLQQ